MILKYYSAGGVPEVDKQNQCKHRQLKTNMLILDLLTQDWKTARLDLFFFQCDPTSGRSD